MPDTLSANLNLLEQATGSASGAWGANLNSAVIAIVDTALGSNQAVSMSSSNVTLTMTQRQNLVFTITGTLSQNVALLLPLQTTATTLAVGGFFIVDNQTTGSFSITVKTAASGSTGVEVPQGVHSLVYSDTTNVWFADDTQNQTQTVSGNPNGSVAGKAGSASTRASKIIDRATNIEYLCTTSGTASSAVWFPNLPFTFPAQGYVTTNSSTTNIIQNSDAVGATTIYYTAYNGGYFFLYNGTSFFPVPITGGQLSLSLSGSSQASNGLYDVIGFLDGSTPRIGFSPAWTTATAGSGNRGSGAGTPQMTRVQGVPVNAVQQTVNNGATTYTVAANRGVVLATVFIDSTAGQVTCHVSYGQSRKWGIANVYNKQPVKLRCGDSTSSWTESSLSFGPAHSLTANSLTVFSSVPEETYDLWYVQNGNAGSGNLAQNGIGYNSVSASSGSNGVINQFSGTDVAHYAAPASLGINTATCLLKQSGSLSTFLGTETNMLLSAAWNA